MPKKQRRREKHNHPSQSQANKIEDMQHQVGDPKVQSDSSIDAGLRSPDEHLPSTRGEKVKCEDKYSTVILIEFSIGLPVILQYIQGQWHPC